jgi:hypothetical protein
MAEKVQDCKAMRETDPAEIEFATGALDRAVDELLKQTSPPPQPVAVEAALVACLAKLISQICRTYGDDPREHAQAVCAVLPAMLRDWLTQASKRVN